MERQAGSKVERLTRRGRGIFTGRSGDGRYEQRRSRGEWREDPSELGQNAAEFDPALNLIRFSAYTNKVGALHEIAHAADGRGQPRHDEAWLRLFLRFVEVYEPSWLAAVLEAFPPGDQPQDDVE